MNGHRFLVLCSVLLTISYYSANAITDEEQTKIIAAILPHVAECAKEFSISPEQVITDGKAGSLDSCVIKCILRRIAVIDDQGLFDPTKALELTKAHISNPDELKTAEEGFKSCASVNEQAVSDGAEGCERVKLLKECIKPYRSQLVPVA